MCQPTAVQQRRAFALRALPARRHGAPEARARRGAETQDVRAAGTKLARALFLRSLRLTRARACGLQICAVDVPARPRLQRMRPHARLLAPGASVCARQCAVAHPRRSHSAVGDVWVPGKRLDVFCLLYLLLGPVCAGAVLASALGKLAALAGFAYLALALLRFARWRDETVRSALQREHSARI